MAARELVEDACHRILLTHRGARAGMFSKFDAQRVTSKEMKRVGKSKVLAEFVKDSSLTDSEKARRIFAWIVNRAPKPKELTVVLKHIKNAKSRQDAYHDIIWAVVNSREFLFQK